MPLPMMMIGMRSIQKVEIQYKKLKKNYFFILFSLSQNIYLFYVFIYGLLSIELLVFVFQIKNNILFIYLALLHLIIIYIILT